MSEPTRAPYKGIARAEAVAAICDGLSGAPDLERQLVRTFLEECFDTWQPRQRKYGVGNIQRYGALGCLVRLSDKTARLDNYYTGGSEEFTDESVIDSWKDLVNYALMGLMCHLGRWPGVPANGGSADTPYQTVADIPADKMWSVPAPTDTTRELARPEAVHPTGWQHSTTRKP